MNRKQIWYLFGAMICILALIAAMIETCVLAGDYIDYAGSILLVAFIMCFAIYSGFMYFYERFFIEHDRT